MFDQDTKIEMERGFVEAAQDDDIAFYTDLRRTIETHALVDIATQARYDLNSQVPFTFQYHKSLMLPIVLSRPSLRRLLQRLVPWAMQLPETMR